MMISSNASRVFFFFLTLLFVLISCRREEEPTKTPTAQEPTPSPTIEPTEVVSQPPSPEPTPEIIYDWSPQLMHSSPALGEKVPKSFGMSGKSFPWLSAKMADEAVKQNTAAISNALNFICGLLFMIFFHNEDIYQVMDELINMPVYYQCGLYLLLLQFSMLAPDCQPDAFDW